ncbi:MAG: hypothetical protein JEY94_13905 [Melioribacteraceae bacterium]|nr:hypothetical protein [Melioribacteraceae bacterium]
MKKILFPIAIFFVIISCIKGQELNRNNYVTDTLKINFDNLYKVNSLNIIPFSETIELRDKLLQKSDYHFNYKTAQFSISDSLQYSIFDTLFITYQTIKLSFQKEYKRRSLLVQYDDRFQDTVKVIKENQSAFTSEDIFGGDLKKSGSIIRGFTVGSNKDFSVNSGLRLQLSGKISDDIEIVAALSDENTPIQPEGNTERLEELDKVFIEVRHPNATGTFGDYSYNIKGTEFGRIERKLQGFKGELKSDDHNITFAFAGSRGKYNTNQFNGIEGVQGPYRLSGENNERNIIVIAGSEKVFIDGEQMKRGENNEYTIEYANAQITFTPNKLITSASRISVDFEYTDRKYNRNFLAASTESKFFNNKVEVKFNFFQEGDDQDSPIDIILSDNEKEILKNAGDNIADATISGISIAPEDSLGNINGYYSKVDTIINGEKLIYFKYNPGSDKAIYNGTFSYVGELKGDYKMISLGRYEFVGIKLGSYLPIKYLPMPQLKQMGNVYISASPLDKLKIDLELAGSKLDLNRFSNIDDNSNFGFSRNISVKLEQYNLKLNNKNYGIISLGYKDRFVGEKYNSLDRINSIEYDREYNIADNSKGDEVLREVNLLYNPIPIVSVSGQYGLVDKDNFTSNRYIGKLSVDKKNEYSAYYNMDFVNTETGYLTTDWTRQVAEASFFYGSFKPGAEFKFENKKEKFSNSDSLLNNSNKFAEFSPYLQIAKLYGVNLAVKYSLRNEYYPINGKLEKESEAVSKSLELDYKPNSKVTSSLNLTFREKSFTEKFKEIGELNNESVLINSRTRLRLFDDFVTGNIFYEASSQRSASLERVFLRVPQGTGNYNYLGDLNNNGVAEEKEFEPVLFDGDFIVTTIPTDELFPVIDLKLDTRWQLDFKKVIKDNSFIGALLNPVSTETFVRVSENSKETDTKKIYLLNFSSFQNAETTVRGSNLFQQDIILFKNSSSFSLRFRYLERKNLSQFAGGVESGYYNEKSIRTRWKLVKEISNQTEYLYKIDNVAAPITSNRARNVFSSNISSDFSYRPYGKLEIGFKLKYARTEDSFPSEPTIIDINEQTIRINYSLAGKGRVRIEAERKELLSDADPVNIPFEVTNGNRLGKNYFWRLNFDYRIASNLQSSVSYQGRIQGGSDTIHTMRAEVKAYF